MPGYFESVLYFFLIRANWSFVKWGRYYSLILCDVELLADYFTVASEAPQGFWIAKNRRSILFIIAGIPHFLHSLHFVKKQEYFFSVCNINPCLRITDFFEKPKMTEII